jgi:sarcosine oxidase
MFDVVVVGSSGLIGSAAVKYLSTSGRSVVGVGSPEPKDYLQHRDVFASHYDEARVARILDVNPVWASLAAESMRRYADIQAQSGIAFHNPVGCLRVGAAGLLSKMAHVGAMFGAEFEWLDAQALTTRFAFVYGAGLPAVIEHGCAGTVSPRGLVRAQHAIAQRAGAHLIDNVVLAIDTGASGCNLRLKSGQRVEARQALVAAGAFTNFHDLLPLKVPYKAMPETVVLMQAPQSVLAQNLPAMLIYRWLNESAPYLYATPPARYADGLCYMKIGALNDGAQVHSLEEAVDYFRSGGNRELAARLAEGARLALPQLRPDDYAIKPCILANTDTGLPYISAVVPDRLFVAAGGCGAAAKSSDEIGRLAAELVLGRERCDAFRLPV